jgi:hypothetical protein
LAVVAIAGICLACILHIQHVISEEDDFAPAILTVEGVAVSMCLAVASAVGLIVRLRVTDEAYAEQLLRNGIPLKCPWNPSDRDRVDRAVTGSNQHTTWEN